MRDFYMILEMSTWLIYLLLTYLLLLVRPGSWPVDMAIFGEKDFANVIKNFRTRSFWIFWVTPEFSERHS